MTVSKGSSVNDGFTINSGRSVNDGPGVSDGGAEGIGIWSIGDDGTSYGYLAGFFGSVNPNPLTHFTLSTDSFTVKTSNDEVLFGLVGDAQEPEADSIVFSVQGYATPILLTWDGFHYTVIDVAFTAYIVTRAGETLRFGYAKIE